MFKKREIDIFGVLLGMVIGCIIGFFLSTRIKINPPSNEDDEKTGAIYGNVYLLQIGKADTAEDANAIIENVKARDLYSVYVYTGGFYYVYGAIGESEDDLAAKKSDFEYKGFSPIVKKEYILDMPNAVLDNTPEYEFWLECVTNLLEDLKGKQFAVSEKFHSNPASLEAYTLTVALSGVKNETLRAEIRLNIYQEIVKNLG
ncbi:MAG: hypothetical protein WBL47_00325 [Bacilli bacterium]|jgi:hypothetical protein|nr:hypothetical protein [Bacillota bacterium]NLM32153.1 hypothetical protein [Acholeplasmataceae bacterium]HOA78560.1 hypothetical protein [Bacilli bacterium]HPZ27317.1 hypothetical protein [Bacilli bacterium]HQC89951.1 hypothetical protein [Bacilli bacterium]